MSATALQRLRAAAPAMSIGILTADLLRLGEEVRLLEAGGARVVHFDVMDGCLCPSMTIGPPLVKAVCTTMLKDVHLMVENPLPKLDAFVAAGADILTVSVEACRHPLQLLQTLGKMQNANDSARGIVRGVGLNPGTPVEMVGPLLDELEMVLLLAVNPGFNGQTFHAGTGRRVERVRELCRQAGRESLVCVDGGVKKNNVAAIAAMGADLIVTGSAVFDGNDAAANLREMTSALSDLAPNRKISDRDNR